MREESRPTAFPRSAGGGLVIEHFFCFKIQAAGGAIDAGKIAGVPGGTRTVAQVFAEHALDEGRSGVFRAGKAVQLREEIL